MKEWVRYTIYCCGELIVGHTARPTCPHCNAVKAEWVKKHTLPWIFCDTRIAITLRWLASLPRDHVHSVRGKTYAGVSHRDFIHQYSVAGSYPQRDPSHFDRYWGWLISRDLPYTGTDNMRVMYLGPSLGDWYEQLTYKKKQTAFRWAESLMARPEQEEEAVFWLTTMKERGLP